MLFFTTHFLHPLVNYKLLHEVQEIPSSSFISPITFLIFLLYIFDFFLVFISAKIKMFVVLHHVVIDIITFNPV